MPRLGCSSSARTCTPSPTVWAVPPTRRGPPAAGGAKVVAGNETFYVHLSNVDGGVLADGIGKGTILNDDAAPVGVVRLVRVAGWIRKGRTIS